MLTGNRRGAKGSGFREKYRRRAQICADHGRGRHGKVRRLRRGRKEVGGKRPPLAPVSEKRRGREGDAQVSGGAVVSRPRLRFPAC